MTQEQTEVILEVTRSKAFKVLEGMEWRPHRPSAWFRVTKADLENVSMVAETSDILVNPFDPATQGCLHSLACEKLGCQWLGTKHGDWEAHKSNGAVSYADIPERILAAFDGHPILCATIGALLHGEQ